MTDLGAELAFSKPFWHTNIHKANPLKTESPPATYLLTARYSHDDLVGASVLLKATGLQGFESSGFKVLGLGV